MRTTRLALSWSAIVLMSGVGVACATATQSTPEGLRPYEGLAQVTPEERRQLRDSAQAQAIADEVGPRVTVSADFEYPSGTSGSRRVDARFHMYDDAYVIVGHMDASGRLTIVFPSAPGDDGFVRGDKIYNVPSFFAGFGDEYAWRYSDYYTRAHAPASRRDSYDAGLAYVFVIASWRPMRLDRITDGNRWQTYNIGDASYMSDPREAIEELGSVIAGDNREAYTIEYAHYTSTNYGQYALSDFDAVNSGCYGYSSSLGFLRPGFFVSRMDYLNGYGYGFGPVNCQATAGLGYLGYGYGYGYGYPYGGYGYGYGSPAPFVPVTGVQGRKGPIATPLGLPGLHLPRVDAGDGALALHGPGAVNPSSPGSQYLRPGLFVQDAGGKTPGERRGTGAGELGFTSERPTITQIIGAHHIDQAIRDGSVGRIGASNDNPAWVSRGAISSPRGADTRANWGEGNSARATGRSYGQPARMSPRGEGSNGGGSNGGGGSTTRSTPSHVSHGGGESARSAPPPSHAAPAHSEPAARSAPAASSGSKKP